MTKMTQSRFRQVRNLFEAALEQDPAGREEFLTEACAADEDLHKEVSRLFAARNEGLSWLDRPAAESARTDPHSLEGRHIGPYQILRELGKGGMGVVYLAARADRAFHKQVAIKIVHAGLGNAEMIARFEQEREILASLDHPNIARLLDGGTTSDGLSYLVMEYIEGRPLDQYCDEQKLDIPNRLELFRTVCAAVEYAHRKRIVHRDLKPANILVTTDGVVKLLDFGIAKLMPDRNRENTGLITRTGLRLMTPEYASPEQVKGEPVGAGADIYALGVVLYELLTGRLPYRMRNRIFHEVIRVICEEPPVRPSTAVSQSRDGSRTTDQISRVRNASPSELSRRLAGDLDGIVLKALEKDARDRYRSASALSDDIERHLEDRPVEARQSTPGYRALKFIGRNLPWAILTAALAVALMSGGITIHWAGLAVIAGCLLAIGVWYAATNRGVGRWVAQSEFLFNYVPQQALLAALAGSFVVQKPGVILFTALSPMIIRQAIGWVGRRRFAGALLLDLTSSLRTGSVPIPLGIVVVACYAIIFIKLHQPAYYLLGYLSGSLTILLKGRVEIRARGVVHCGSLYSWERIESYEWKTGRAQWEGGAKMITLGLTKDVPRPDDILVLRLRRTVQFLPPARVPIPYERRDEVDSIMQRYLSEWPGTPVENAVTATRI
jgi:serine/threonine protein kinase